MTAPNRPTNWVTTIADLVRRVGLLERRRTVPLTSDDDITITTPGRLNLEADSGTFITHDTTAAAANTVITATGQIMRSTSSRRYKRNITAANLDPDVILHLAPRRFIDKSEDTRRVGFIAEEADDLGLTEWVTYDKEGLPEAFDYATWCVALQAVARSQAEEIRALRVRVDALIAATINTETGEHRG